MTQTAWLVEWPATKHDPVRYWHATEPRMIDARDATWLARREDAEAIIKRDKLFAGAHAVERIFGLTGDQEQLTRGEIEDVISDAISDSIDMDWTSRIGARHVVDALIKEGVVRFEP